MAVKMEREREIIIVLSFQIICIFLGLQINRVNVTINAIND